MLRHADLVRCGVDDFRHSVGDSAADSGSVGYTDDGRIDDIVGGQLHDHVDRHHSARDDIRHDDTDGADQSHYTVADEPADNEFAGNDNPDDDATDDDATDDDATDDDATDDDATDDDDRTTPCASAASAGPTSVDGACCRGLLDGDR